MNLIDSIKKRPAMYIGSLDIHGVKNILGNFFDDILKNNTQKIEIIIYFQDDNWIKLRIKNINTTLLIETLDILESENNFLNFGLPCIIALSEKTKIKISNNTSLYSLVSTKGIYNCKTSICKSEKNNIEIDFKIDQNIFKKININYEVINNFLQQYAYLNTNCKIISIDNTKEIKQTNLFDYPNGLSHQLDYKIATQPYGGCFNQSSFRLDLNTKIEEYTYQICISYHTNWIAQNYVKTYSNNDELVFGGSLEQGIIDGLKLAIKQIVEQQGYKFEKRELKKCLFLIATIKGNNFHYYGSIRTKLDMPKVRKEIKEYVTQETLRYLAKNKEIEDMIIDKFKIYP